MCGQSALPEDTAHAIEATAFAQYGEDLNGDGIVSVKLNQYVSDTEDVENASAYSLRRRCKLSDMNAEESCFLLLDDPVHFQLDYQALCQLGRHPPGDNDYTATTGKTAAWGRLPGAGRYDLGTYQTTTVLNHRYWQQRRTGKRIIFRPQGLFAKSPRTKKAAHA